MIQSNFTTPLAVNEPILDYLPGSPERKTLKKAIGRKLVESAHDVSDGGVFANLVESAMPGNLGFDIVSHPEIRTDAWLFGESQSRAIVSVKQERSSEFEHFLHAENVVFEHIGKVKSDSIVVNGENWGTVKAWQRTYDNVLSQIMNN